MPRVLTVLCAVLVATTLVSAADFGGFVTKVFASNFLARNALGPVGIIFDPNETGALYVTVPGELPQAGFFKFQASHFTGGSPLSGSPQTSPYFKGNIRSTSGVNLPNADGIAFGKDGKLYCAIREGTFKIAEINKDTGEAVRFLTNTMPVSQQYLPTSLATDPLTGDLFTGNVIENGGISRISGVSTANADLGSPAIPTQFLTPIGGTLPVVDGIVFGQDGTLYFAALEPHTNWPRGVYRATRTSPTSFGTATMIKQFTNLPDGIQIWPGATATAMPKALFVATNQGTITRLHTETWNGQPGTCTSEEIYTGGTRGDFSTVGPDGCLYTTQSTTIVKTTNQDGTCSLLPIVPADSTLLLYGGPSAAQCNENVVVSASLKNLGTNTMIAGAPVTFTAGSASCSATTDANGIARCPIAGSALTGGTANAVNVAYAGVGTTVSPATASASINVGTCIDATELLYIGDTSTECDRDAAVSASLRNTATNSMIAGATIIFAYGGAGSCSAVTDANGIALCYMPGSILATGANTISVDYAGSGITLAPASTTASIEMFRDVHCIQKTVMAYDGPTSAECDADVVVSAVLQNRQTFSLIAGATLAFTAGSGSCTGTTDANGIASCTIAGSALTGGANVVNVAYAGVGTTVSPATASGSINVVRDAECARCLACTGKVMSVMCAQLAQLSTTGPVQGC
eukprot:TRINITY_DN2643_c0_g1_i1.p1 TRINITY_DN2643_c0_g1~~TRINITY_DN2643_c0_g1_i1.p1  ORF type:complete len:691 (+),score=161.27 TRINITY_DN2643_c0_g1_i1:84-2156(+)